MPGPRGNEIARRMRTIEAFKTIPIVLMTAFTLDDQERQSMVRDDGVDYIINKPLPDFFELKKQLEEICEKKKVADQRQPGQRPSQDAETQRQSGKRQMRRRKDRRQAPRSNRQGDAEKSSATTVND